MNTIESRRTAVRSAALSYQSRMASPKTTPGSPSRAKGESMEERATPGSAPASVIAEAAVRRLARGDAAAAVGLRILRALDRQGPLTAAEIPRTRPVTRSHVRALLRDLAADGLVAATTADGCRSYRLTDLGRRCLEEIDWAEAIELESDPAGTSGGYGVRR